MFEKKKKNKDEFPINGEEKKKGKHTLLGLVFSVVMACIIFFGMTSYQAQKMDNYVKEKKVVAKADIPANTLITQDNVDKYFDEMEINKKLVVSDSVENKNDMVGYVCEYPVANAQVISKKNFVAKDSILSSIKNKAYITFTASNIGSAVGGTIREGSVINVDVVSDEGTEQAGQFYVNAVYDTNGTKLSNTDGDKNKTALVIEIVIDKTQITQFEDKLSKGNVYISKVTEDKK